MRIVKKLSFVPLFLISLAILIYQVSPILNSYAKIFSFNLDFAWQLAILAVVILATSLSFVIFGTLCQDWRMVPVVAIIAAGLPFLILSGTIAIVLAVAFFLSLILTFSLLDQKLRTYFNFQPAVILGPEVKNLATLLVIGLSVAFYFSANAQIQDKGFEIPDELINAAIKLGSPPSAETDQFVKGEKYLAQITPAQLELLKQHPEILKQYNIDPKTLDSLSAADSGTTKATSIPVTSLVSNKLIKDQFNNILKPYTNWIAPILAGLFFSTMAGFLWIGSFFLSPIISLIFLAFEKSGFVSFTKEMREVKKMVV